MNIEPVSLIIGTLAGVLVGSGVVYTLYRRTKAELDNIKLYSESYARNRNAQNIPPDANPTQAENRRKANLFEAIARELDTDDPLTAVRYLKKHQSAANRPSASPRFDEPAAETELPAEPTRAQSMAPMPPMTPLEPLPPLNTARSEVFYFPPPDPSGQFDGGQKSDILSPESAYRFSVSAENQTVATFRFEADPARLSRLLTYRNYMIEPACDSENSYSSTFTRVTTIRDGEATLENGSWRVKTKALVRYD